MVKDDDAKEWVFVKTKSVLIEKERCIDVALVFYTELDDETIYELEMESINNGIPLNSSMKTN